MFWKVKILKVQRSAKISISGGGVLESQNTQSAKICLNFNLGGGVFWKVKILTVPRSVQISIWGGGCSEKSKLKVARSVQISIFWGGGCSEPNSRTGVF